MQDKEIGELWLDHANCRKHSWACDQTNLIRKLVEVEAKLCHVEEDTLRYQDEWEGMPDKIGNARVAAREKYHKQARRQYGIPEEEEFNAR